MDLRASAFWVRLKANRWAYTLTILATLTMGILIGTVISYGVKGKEGAEILRCYPADRSSPAAALEHLLADFEATRTERGQHQYRVHHQESSPPRRTFVRPNPDQDDQGGGRMTARSRISLTNFSAAKAGPMPETFASARSDPASSLMPRATSSPTATWSKRRIAFA